MESEFKRALEDFTDPFKLQRFRRMMQETNACMARRKKNNLSFDTDLCENAELSQMNYWTFHTHPHGKTTPSGLDVSTSKKLGKKLLCIGLAPTGEIICYDTSGKRVISKMKL